MICTEGSVILRQITVRSNSYKEDLTGMARKTLHSLNKCFLNTCYAAGMVQSTGISREEKTEILTLIKLIF